MDPEHVIDDEGAGALLAGRDGVEMVGMFVGRGAEGRDGRLDVRWIVDGLGRIGGPEEVGRRERERAAHGEGRDRIEKVRRVRGHGLRDCP